MGKKICKVLVLSVVVVMAMIGCSNYSEDSGDDPSAQSISATFQGQQDSVGSLSNRDLNFTLSKIQVSQGDTLQIIPSSLTVEKFTQAISEPKHQDNQACVQSEQICLQQEPVFQRQCHQSCHLCVHCSFLGCYPSSCCDTSCNNVQIGTRCARSQTHCLKTENQWTNTRSCSSPKSSGAQEVSDPNERAQDVAAGIQLQFLDQNGKPRGSACPLKNFNPQVDPSMISVPILNAKGCDHFFGDSDESKLTVLVANRISLQQKFKVGDEVQTWDNRTIAPANVSTVDLVTSFSGTLRVPIR